LLVDLIDRELTLMLDVAMGFLLKNFLQGRQCLRSADHPKRHGRLAANERTVVGFQQPCQLCGGFVDSGNSQRQRRNLSDMRILVEQSLQHLIGSRWQCPNQIASGKESDLPVAIIQIDGTVPV